MVYDDVAILCQRNETLHGWLRDRGLLADLNGGRCKKCECGNVKLRKDISFSKDGCCWRCNNKSCNKKISIRRDSFFSNSALTIDKILKLTYMWVWKLPEYYVKIQLKIGSEETMVDWYSFCREVCLCSLEEW